MSSVHRQLSSALSLAIIRGPEVHNTVFAKDGAPDLAGSPKWGIVVTSAPPPSHVQAP